MHCYILWRNNICLRSWRQKHWLRTLHTITHQTARYIIPTKTAAARFDRFSLTAEEIYDFTAFAVLLSFIFANTHLVIELNSTIILRYQGMLCLFQKKGLNYGNTCHSNISLFSQHKHIWKACSGWRLLMEYILTLNVCNSARNILIDYTLPLHEIQMYNVQREIHSYSSLHILRNKTIVSDCSKL